MANNKSIEQLLDRNLPTFSITEAQQMAKQHFALEGEFTALVSERDQGFRVHTVNNEDFTFKISNSGDDFGVIDFQTQALLHIQEQNSALPVPRIIRSLTGDTCVVVEGDSNKKHIVRVLSFFLIYYEFYTIYMNLIQSSFP